MKIAISCVITEETAGPAVVARTAESLGFEGLFIPEHPVIPVVHRTRYPDPASDGEIPEFYSHMPDPLRPARDGGAGNHALQDCDRYLPGTRAQPDPARQGGRHARSFFQ